MQLGPGQHEPQLPDVKVAFDYLDLVDPDLRLPVGVTRVKVRMPVIVEVHCDHDAEETTDRPHDARCCRTGPSTLAVSVLPPARAT